jgi:hypothetical protein
MGAGSRLPICRVPHKNKNRSSATRKITSAADVSARNATQMTATTAPKDECTDPERPCNES